MIQKAILRLQHPGLCVLTFLALLLALARYSYRAKELLVCWLLFCSFFAASALIVLGITFGCFAGHLLLKWLKEVKAVIPELVVALAEAPQESLSVPEILTSATLKLSLSPCAPAIDFNSAPCLLIEVASSSADNVRN
jgi:hypothetical protein